MKITGGSLHAKNGFWQVVFYVNHKQKWRSTKIAIPNEDPNSSKYKKSRMEAYKCIEMLKKQLQYDLEHPIAKIKGEKIKEHISLVSLLREWLQDDALEQVRLQTLSTYRNYAEKRIIPFFEQYYPDLEAAALTPQIMHEFTNYMKADKLTNASIRKYLAPVRNALEYGFEKGYLQQDPIAGYRFKPGARQAPDSSRKKQALSVDACNRLMAAMAADADAPVCVPIMLALHLGLRREEILGLRFRDIDFSAKTLHVQNTRTNVYEIVEEENTKSSASNRILYLDDELVSFLKKNSKKAGPAQAGPGRRLYGRDRVCVCPGGRKNLLSGHRRKTVEKISEEARSAARRASRAASHLLQQAADGRHRSDNGTASDGTQRPENDARCLCPCISGKSGTSQRGYAALSGIRRLGSCCIQRQTLDISLDRESKST